MPSIVERSTQLRSIVRLLSDAAETVIRQWEFDEISTELGEDSAVPTDNMYNARRTIVGACGMLVDLVQDPVQRLLDVNQSAALVRCLYIAARARMADVLATGDSHEGISVREISSSVGIDHRKLARILRCLCTNHIFAEVKPDHFANNPTSQALVDNEPLRSFLLHGGLTQFTALNSLPTVLFDPKRTNSYSMQETALQEAHGNDLTLWEYYASDTKNVHGIPESEVFGLGMVGISMAVAPSLCAGYPWADLGSNTVVDVGGGVGGMSLYLAKEFPELRIVVQDLEAVIKQADAVWRRELPGVIDSSRVKLMSHDFFTEQPIKGAAVYLLRGVLHDWPDDVCVNILSQLREAMGAKSRILVADIVIQSTADTTHVGKAPWPLLANYGAGHAAKNYMDLMMMALCNGMERTPEELDSVAGRAGLKVAKIWECRTFLWITELRKFEEELH